MESASGSKFEPRSSQKYQTKMDVGNGQVLLIPLVPLVVRKKEPV